VTRYVYICSHRHSGSTLLDLLLGSHSRIESLGEISFLSQDLALNLPCTCGLRIRECTVWQTVIDRLSAQLGTDIMANPYALHLGYPLADVTVDRTHQTRAYRARRELMLGMYYLRMRFGARFLDPLLGRMRRSFANNFRVYDAAREVLNADLVVDSSKTYLKALGIYQQNPEQVRVILLTRDGRGVLYSNIRRKRSRNESVAGWVTQHTRALPLFRQHIRPDHLLFVKYEAVTVDPAREMSRICRFLGVDFEPAMLDFTAKVHHSTDGNNMRLQRSASIRVDNQWMERLSEDDLRYFEQHAGWLNRELGYT
jgi:Sulfotransferase family